MALLFAIVHGQFSMRTVLNFDTRITVMAKKCIGVKLNFSANFLILRDDLSYTY